VLEDSNTRSFPKGRTKIDVDRDKPDKGTSANNHSVASTLVEARGGAMLTMFRRMGKEEDLDAASWNPEVRDFEAHQGHQRNYDRGEW
jgi:hypothetical protein